MGFPVMLRSKQYFANHTKQCLEPNVINVDKHNNCTSVIDYNRIFRRFIAQWRKRPKSIWF